MLAAEASAVAQRVALERSSAHGSLRIGLLGGTFDPPTRAHVAVAEAALASLALDEVWLVPTGRPTDKTPSATPEQRVAMCRLAVEGRRGLAVSTVDVDRPGPTFTIDTVRELATAHPEVRFLFLIGSDIAVDSWGDFDECRRYAEFVRVMRGDLADPGDLPSMDLGRFTISSTAVRAALGQGVRSDDVLPAVADYIAVHGLYHP